MNYASIRAGHTYTADEVREIINGQGDDFRRAFDDLHKQLEAAYQGEVERMHSTYTEQTTKWLRFNRWTTWGCWALMWLSGFFFHPIFDKVWSN